MLAKCIVLDCKQEIPLSSVFFRKLLKITILIEQWPSLMTWILVLVDLYEREKLMIGESMNNSRYGIIAIMKKISENEDDISLSKIFKHIAQTLIHTSDDQ